LEFFCFRLGNRFDLLLLLGGKAASGRKRPSSQSKEHGYNRNSQSWAVGAKTLPKSPMHAVVSHDGLVPPWLFSLKQIEASETTESPGAVAPGLFISWT
jgi:hypothetical protein